MLRTDFAENLPGITSGEIFYIRGDFYAEAAPAFWRVPLCDLCSLSQVLLHCFGSLLGIIGDGEGDIHAVGLGELGAPQNERFIDCVAWRSTGEFVSKYFQKGRMAVVSGRLQIRSWTDKDGNKRRSAEVVADNVYFGDSRRESDGTGNMNAAPAAPAYSAPAGNTLSDFAMLEDDDAQLPF